MSPSSSSKSHRDPERGTALVLNRDGAGWDEIRQDGASCSNPAPSRRGETSFALFSNQHYALPGSHPNNTHGSVLNPTLRLLRQVVGVDRVPVHHIPKGGNVVRTAVLIMQIIGMFPNVQPQNRHMSVHQGTVLVGG